MCNWITRLYIVTATHRYQVKEQKDSSTKLGGVFMWCFLRDCVANGHSCGSCLNLVAVPLSTPLVYVPVSTIFFLNLRN